MRYNQLLFVLLLASSALAQVGSNCGSHPNLHHDSTGKQTWFTSQQLNEMAVKKVKPELPPLPSNFRYDGDVILKVLISAKGEVSCIWGTAGSPIMLPAAVMAAQQWRFKPLLANGRPVEFTGTLRLHFSTDTGGSY